MDTNGRPASSPANTTVPVAAAYTGWPGVPARSTPRWPRFQFGDGASNTRITAGRGLSGQPSRPSSACATGAHSIAIAIANARLRICPAQRDGRNPAMPKRQIVDGQVTVEKAPRFAV
jgi:hypothetical protein